MALARELLEVFLEKVEKNDYAYHLHEVEELVSERDEDKESIERITRELSAMPVPVDLDRVVKLNQELIYLNYKLERMNRVLAFCGAEEGYLVTKVVTTVEWEEQEPIYYTNDPEKANKAFEFFNAHAVIDEDYRATHSREMSPEMRKSL